MYCFQTRTVGVGKEAVQDVVVIVIPTIIQVATIITDKVDRMGMCIITDKVERMSIVVGDILRLNCSPVSTLDKLPRIDLIWSKNFS